MLKEFSIKRVLYALPEPLSELILLKIDDRFILNLKKVFMNVQALDIIGSIPLGRSIAGFWPEGGVNDTIILRTELKNIYGA